METSDPEGEFESVELKRIVSDKTTEQLEKHLELPLVNDEREATRPEVARQADEKKREGPDAEKSDIPVGVPPRKPLSSLDKLKDHEWALAAVGGTNVHETSRKAAYE
jgi:hypothetical protein